MLPWMNDLYVEKVTLICRFHLSKAKKLSLKRSRLCSRTPVSICIKCKNLNNFPFLLKITLLVYHYQVSKPVSLHHRPQSTTSSNLLSRHPYPLTLWLQVVWFRRRDPRLLPSNYSTLLWKLKWRRSKWQVSITPRHRTWKWLEDWKGLRNSNYSNHLRRKLNQNLWQVSKKLLFWLMKLTAWTWTKWLSIWLSKAHAQL